MAATIEWVKQQLKEHPDSTNLEQLLKELKEHNKKKKLSCKFQVLDDAGAKNCTFYDGTIGYCTPDTCPLINEVTF